MFKILHKYLITRKASLVNTASNYIVEIYIAEVTDLHYKIHWASKDKYTWENKETFCRNWGTVEELINNKPNISTEQL